MCTVQAAAAYLSSRSFPADAKVYVVGEEGIQEELDLAGIRHIGGPEHSSAQPDMGPGGMLEVDPRVKAVVAGFDRHINYYKIQYATQCVRELGAQLIATNRDAVTHLTSAQKWAGGGAMVAAIAAAAQQEPTVVGKPSTFMLEHICDSFAASAWPMVIAWAARRVTLPVSDLVWHAGQRRARQQRDY